MSVYSNSGGAGLRVEIIVFRIYKKKESLPEDCSICIILNKYRVDSLKLKELENIVEEGEDDDSQFVCKTLVHSSLKTNCETIWQYRVQR